ncbi:MAG: hypothetical protein JXR31_06690 [Prolixibacteraceae bacterium]|nr:hypothetical protein [Prolixibacteraceae bacterium]MBN2773918.1 hypothetical protein [Prolixibacteraceae bacterium]
MENQDMETNEIKLIKEQLLKLDDKDFNLDAWKKHTIIFLERFFGSNSSKVKLIEDLRYDYSSWNLRDIAGSGKTKDPVKTQAAEILEAIVYELEKLGLPKESKVNDKLLSLLSDELTGKQIKEIEHILEEKTTNKTEKIQDILNNLEKENLSLIVSRLLTS